MYNASTIKTGFSGLLGVKDSKNPTYPSVPSTLSDSVSGLYLNTDFHPITTIENIYYATTDVYKFAEQWVIGTYAVGDIVKNGDFSYTSLSADNVEEPTKDSTKWEWTVYTTIREMIDKANVTVVRNMLQEMKLTGQTKGMFSDLRIFDRSGQYQDTVTKRGAFVGLRIDAHSTLGLQLAIKTIGIQLTKAQSILTIYCYHSSINEPLFTFDMENITAKNFTWFTNFNKVLSGNALTNDSGGYFYLGYYDEDLDGNAINRKYDFSRAPCSGCTSQQYDYLSYKQWSKYYKICAFYVVDINDDRTLFDTEDVVEEYNNNFGLNISVGVQCDASDFIVDNKLLFSDAVGTQFSIDTMRMIANAPRGNNMTDRLREYAAIQLNGAVSDLGYIQNGIKSIRAINVDFSSLGSPCFSNRVRGIRKGVI